MDKAKLMERYGTSADGNFYVGDTIGVPHAYCIGPEHVALAADHWGGILGKDAIESAERAGIKCCTCRGQLKYEQHKTALLVECKKELKGADGQVDPELHAYLLKCKPLADEDKYAGFAFVRSR